MKERFYMKKRKKQLFYSKIDHTNVYNTSERKKQARKFIAILSDHLGKNKLLQSNVLDVGSSTGIISAEIGKKVKSVIGIDIDEAGIQYAKKRFVGKTISFKLYNGKKFPFKKNTFDIITCNQVYEHVVDQQYLVNEIYRVLKPGGVCEFGAMSKYCIREPHYNLLFLSWLPYWLADIYIRITQKGTHYYERPLSYIQLQKLFHRFDVYDYTPKIIADPKKYHFTDKIKTNSLMTRLSGMYRYYRAFVSTYYFVLNKPTH